MTKIEDAREKIAEIFELINRFKFLSFYSVKNMSNQR